MPRLSAIPRVDGFGYRSTCHTRAQCDIKELIRCATSAAPMFSYFLPRQREKVWQLREQLSLCLGLSSFGGGLGIYL